MWLPLKATTSTIHIPIEQRIINLNTLISNNVQAIYNCNATKIVIIILRKTSVLCDQFLCHLLIRTFF